MRDILLGKPFGKVIWVKGISNIWPLLNEGIFLLFFFHEEFAQTEEQVWSQFNTSWFKFGILAKKSASGRKLFLKSITPENYETTEATSVQAFEIDEKTNKTSIQHEGNIKVESQPEMV